MNSYKKRIAIDARLALRPLRGIPLYVARLCEFLPSLRKDYLFYLFVNKGFEHNDTPENYQSRLSRLLEQPNVRIVNCDHDAEILWEQLYLPRLLRQHGIDLLHMPGNRIPFFSPVPTVVTVHDVIEYSWLKNHFFPEFLQGHTTLRHSFYQCRIAAYVWANYAIGSRRARRIITVSEYSSADIVKSLKLRPTMVTAIHHGLDEEFRVSSCSGLSARRHTLMLGGDTYHKNPVGAIAAWAKVPRQLRQKYPLKVIGFCGNDESPLMVALKDHRLLDEVAVHGWVTQQELIELLRGAALFLYLSRYEGFGFPLLQAMASGTPVISGNATSLPEVLGGIAPMFDPDAHDEIASGIEKMLTDADSWSAQCAAGLQRAEKFSWKESAASHLRVYEETLGGRE